MKKYYTPNDLSTDIYFLCEDLKGEDVYKAEDMLQILTKTAMYDTAQFDIIFDTLETFSSHRFHRQRIEQCYAKLKPQLQIFKRVCDLSVEIDAIMDTIDFLEHCGVYGFEGIWTQLVRKVGELGAKKVDDSKKDYLKEQISQLLIDIQKEVEKLPVHVIAASAINTLCKHH